MDYLTTHTSLSPIRRGFAPGFVNYKKGALDSQPQVIKVYQLLAHDRWFSPCTPASSTTKTGRHDIAEILLKVALNTIKSINQSIKDYSHNLTEILLKVALNTVTLIQKLYFIKGVNSVLDIQIHIVIYQIW